jgi:hypothetical protein
MGLLGGIMRSVINPMTLAQLAMGPAGWASLAMKTIGSAIAQQLIQQIGQRLGLPQTTIDLAQAAFANASGQPGLVRQNIGEAVRGFTEQLDLRPSDAGQLQRELMSTSDKSLENMNRIVERMARKLQDEEGEGGTAASSGSGSVLMRIARAMGKLMDEKMNAMAAKGDQLGRLGNDGALTKDGNFNAKGQSQYGKLTSEMQALGQELSMISQAVSNSLKSIGEASTTMARKS